MRRQEQSALPAARTPRTAPLLESLESRVLLTADDQISEAIATTVGSTINSNIDVGTDVDMYKFPVTAGQTVGFDTDVAGLDSMIRLFNVSGAELAFSDDNPAPGEASGLGSYLEYTFPSAGTFYLGVSSYNNRSYDAITGNGDVAGSTTGTYTLILSNIVPNQPPTIGSLSDSPDPVTAPATVTLTANSVADPGGGSVANVQFFRESNGVAGFQLGDDTLLATDTIAPYTTTVATSALPVGTHTYYARATDTLGLGGNAVSTTNTLSGPTGSISGTVWNDADGDKVFDAGEAVLPGWTVYLDNNRNQILDGGDVSTTSNPSGVYTFSGLNFGTYYVTTQTPAGWEQTSPGAGGFINPASAQVTTKSSGVTAKPAPKITTTASPAPVYPMGEPTKDPGGGDGTITPRDAESNPLIRLTNFQADPRFSAIRGQGFSVAVLDTGINASHPAFGGRVVYQQDFANGDMNAQDFHGHGTNVSSIVGSADATHPGMAPQVNIIALKVFTDAGAGNFTYIEQALQWVVANAAAYNIAAINMSVGDGGNYNTSTSLYGIGDEMAALAAMNVMVISAAGNDFFLKNSVQGVAYPAADPNSFAIGAVFDANLGPLTGNGATNFSTAPDHIAGFSQRSWTMVEAFAPGALITGAGLGGGTLTQGGTSQASPHIAGIAALAQQIAMRDLGRRLTMAEFAALLKKSGVLINDGDDENDNVVNTGAYFRRVDVLALGEAILAMAPGPYTQAVTLTHGENDAGIDFGARAGSAPTGSISGKTFDDYDGDDVLDAGEPARPGVTVYIDANGNNALDGGEPTAFTDVTGAYTFGGLAAGTYDVRQVVPAQFISTLIESNVALGADETKLGVNFGEFRVIHLGSSAGDSFTIRRDVATGTRLEVALAGGPTWGKLLSSINALSATGVDITPGDGDDTLTVDYSNGAPIPSVGVDFNGSTHADQLIVTGAAAGEAYSLFNNRVTRTGDVNAAFFSNVESITLHTLGGGDTINVASAPAIPVTVNGGDGNDTMNVNAALVTTILFNGGLAAGDADTLNVNAGTFTFNADANAGTANLQLNLNNAGSQAIFNTTQHLAGLALGAGTTATMSANGKRYLFTKNLVIPATATLNLTDNDLLWDYGVPAPYASVKSLVADGRIATTPTPGNDTTLAIVDNALFNATQWLGQTIDATTIIGKYTYFGDANLDGIVTTDDYVAVDLNLGRGEIDGSAQWFHGDFNNSGSVTTDDYIAVDLNLGKGSVTPLATAEPEPVALTTAATVATTTTTINQPTIEQSWIKPAKKRLGKLFARR